MSRDLLHQSSWEFSSPAGKVPGRESRTTGEDAMGHLEGMTADESERRRVAGPQLTALIALTPWPGSCLACMVGWEGGKA